MGSDVKKVTESVLPIATFGISELFKKPPTPPTPGAPPAGTPPPTMSDRNRELTAAERSKRLSALKFGMASTIKNNPTLASAAITAPGLMPPKVKLGA